MISIWIMTLFIIGVLLFGAAPALIAYLVYVTFKELPLINFVVYSLPLVAIWSSWQIYRFLQKED